MEIELARSRMKSTQKQRSKGVRIKLTKKFKKTIYTYIIIMIILELSLLPKTVPDARSQVNRAV